jgi:diguanylate cyclase (GGDEF)-like protein
MTAQSHLPGREGERTASSKRWRVLLGLLGTAVAILLVVVEALVLHTYNDTQRTTQDFQTTTDTTTGIANVQREALLLQFQVHQMVSHTPGRYRESPGVDLRRGTLGRQLDVVAAESQSRPALRRELAQIRSEAALFDRAFAAAQAGHWTTFERGRRASLERPLAHMALIVKATFDNEEHALYSALSQSLHQRAKSQRMLVAVSILSVLLAALLAAAIWRVVRRDFQRAYSALAAEAGERETLQDQLAYDATHDPLTGLGNRTKLRSEIELTRALGSQSALLYLDLDGFKAINDTLGHEAGDEVLCAVAQRIAATIRPGDSLARLGGDEFAVLLAGVTSSGEAGEVAERLRSAVSAPCRVAGRTASVGASIGVVLAHPELSADELLSSADLAMYSGKHDGKNMVRFYDPAMATEALSRGELEDELDGAMERGELELHYQPIFGLADRQVTGLEALIRWRHSHRGLLMPGQFLPAAEQSGRMAALGRWVLRQACADAARWSPNGDEPAPWVSVNIAPSHVEDANLVDDVRRALEASGLPAERLVLEMSEWASLSQDGLAARGLAGIGDLGVRIALDDFGMGYTALSSLRSGSLDILKLDKSLVDGIVGNAAQFRIVEAFVELARTLGLATVAEGIEDEAQLETLRRLGCDSGQGFYLARPLAPESLPRFAQEQRLRAPVPS